MTQVAVILPQSITQIGDFTAIDNDWLGVGLADYLAIDPEACSGFGDAPLRTTVYDAAGQHGAFVFPPKDGALIMTVVGDLIVTSTGHSAEDGYFEAVSALYTSLKDALDALRDAPDDLVHLDGSMKVWKNGPLEPTWTSYYTMRVTFSLVQDVFA